MPLGSAGRAEERLEDPPHCVRWDARPVVGYLQAHAPRVAPGANRHLRTLDVACILRGVSEQVPENRAEVLGRDRDMTVVAFFTDPAAMDKVLNGMGSVEVGATGTGSGSATTGPTKTGSGTGSGK